MPQRTVTSDSSDRWTINWSNSTGKDWSYAFGFFDEDTATESLRGLVFWVRASTSETCILCVPLPVLPSAGDTFRLCAGARAASDKIASLSTVGGHMPTLDPLDRVEISGVQIKQAFSDVNLYLRYDADEDTLSISDDGGTWVSPVDVSGPSDVEDGFLQAPEGQWLAVDVDISALPSDSAESRVVCGRAYGSILPQFQIDSANEGSIFHSFMVVKNTSGDTEEVEWQTPDISTGNLSAVFDKSTDDYLEVSDGSDLPERDFWLLKFSAPYDLIYVSKRIGNTCYVEAMWDWWKIPFSSGAVEPEIGIRVYEQGGSASGVLQAAEVTSGTWAGGDAAGYFYISSGVGSFSNSDVIEKEDGTNIAVAADDATRWCRGFEQVQNWGLGDSLVVYPNFDLGVYEEDSSGMFEEIEDNVSPIPMSIPTWGFSGGVWLTSENLSMASSGGVVLLIFRVVIASNAEPDFEVSDEFYLTW